MKNSRMLALASALVLCATAAAAQSKPAAPAPAAPSTARAKFVPPVRGVAELGMTKMASKRTGNEVVTTFKVKNMSMTNSIVGLKIEEYWYDKGGNPVTGDTFRLKKPLLPQEVVDVSFHTPIDSKMVNSQYKFVHANGDVKPKTVPKL